DGSVALADLMIVHIRPGYSHQHTRMRASASRASKLPNRTRAARAAIGRQRFMAAATPRSPRRDCRARRKRPGVGRGARSMMNSRRLKPGMVLSLLGRVASVTNDPAGGGPRTRLACTL